MVLYVIQKLDYDEKTNEETRRELDSKDRYKQELGKELARVEQEKTWLYPEVAKYSEEPSKSIPTVSISAELSCSGDQNPNNNDQSPDNNKATKGHLWTNTPPLPDGSGFNLAVPSTIAV